mgnify:CR=1 FL=1
MFANGVEELAPAGQRRSQFIPECGGRTSGEPPLAVRESQNEIISGPVNADRFLDQPPDDGFRYPPKMSGWTS